MLDTIRSNLEQNLARVENLVKTYESHPDAQGQGRKTVEVLDILRAAVVLLHATLEDVLRSVARWKLPAASAAVLNDVPLAGSGPNPRKFFLGDLVAHRGKSVDDLLVQSVESHLEHSNFNSTEEIASLLQDIGVDVSSLNSTFSELQALMERRHQIVHRADRQSKVDGSGDHKVRSIGKETVRSWVDSVSQFATDLFGEL